MVPKQVDPQRGTLVLPKEVWLDVEYVEVVRRAVVVLDGALATDGAGGGRRPCSRSGPYLLTMPIPSSLTSKVRSEIPGRRVVCH